MKIGFVLDDTLDKPDGVQQYALTLGNWFKHEGHEVHYIVGQSSRTDIANVHSVAHNVPVTFNRNKLSIPLPARRAPIKQLLRELDLDVLHVQMPYSPFMAAKVVRLAPQRTAVVGTFHILPFSWLERIATRCLRVLLWRSLRRFDATYAVSPAAKDFAESSFGGTYGVLPNVVDVAHFRAASAQAAVSQKLVIAFLGRLVSRKGAFELVRAIELLPDEIKSNLEVRIGGKGELYAELNSYLRERRLQHIVKLQGFVAEDAKPSFLGGANIAVFPALGGESFGIVLLEAMAARAGVVMGGDNPGYRSVIGDWPDTLVDPTNTAAFAAKLETMILKPALRKQLHHAQQAAVVNYDVSVVGLHWLKVYRQLLRRRKNMR